MIDKVKREPPHLNIDAPSATDTEQAVNESPGRLIRQARERVQMSLDELAAQTKLSRNVLDALERDDFKILREPVYVRGYYRRCCKSLTLSEETLIAAYKRVVGSASLTTPSKLLLVPENEVFGSRGRGSMRWWIVLLVVIAVLVAAYWYLHNRTNLTAVPPVPVIPSSTTQGSNTASPAADSAATAGKVATVTVSTTPTPTSAASTTDAVPVGAQAGPSASQMTPPPVAAGPSAAVPPPVEAGPAASPPAAATGSSLILNFNKTSWVRIEDSTGKVLLTGVIPAGGKQVLVGKPPYSIFLGNAPGVTVEYDGKTIDAQRFTKPNSTARFSVPQG